jgi:hypothetical protein
VIGQDFFPPAGVISQQLSSSSYPMVAKKSNGGQEQLFSPLLLSMANSRAHAALLLSQLATPFTTFLDPHRLTPFFVMLLEQSIPYQIPRAALLESALLAKSLSRSAGKVQGIAAPDQRHPVFNWNVTWVS